MILGILGRSRTGKDCVARYFESYFGFEVHRLSSPVKSACKELLGLSDEHIEGSLKDVVLYGKTYTPRDCMTWLASETKARFSESFLFDRLLERTRGQNIIIPDVRYHEDVQLIRAHGGVIIKLTRAAAPIKHKFEDHVDDVDDADYVVCNDGTLEDLRLTIQCISHRIKHGSRCGRHLFMRVKRCVCTLRR